MTDSVDYVASAVRYDSCGRISRAKVHEIKGRFMGPPQELTREQLRLAMRNGAVVAGAVRSGDGVYQPEERIHEIPVGREIYLRTDARPVARDELSRVPSY
jgi:hypothetical protein